MSQRGRTAERESTSGACRPPSLGALRLAVEAMGTSGSERWGPLRRSEGWGPQRAQPTTLPGHGHLRRRKWDGASVTACGAAVAPLVRVREAQPDHHRNEIIEIAVERRLQLHARTERSAAEVHVRIQLRCGAL